MNKEQIISKIVKDLPIKEMRSQMSDEEWYGWFEECWNKAINYNRCCTELLCVKEDVDGLTAGKYYVELYKDRTHTKVVDDYGIETMYFSDRFVKTPKQ